MKNEKNEPKKISREELMKMANLTEDDLEKVSGGGSRQECIDNCEKACKTAFDACLRSVQTGDGHIEANQRCEDTFDGCKYGCSLCFGD